MRRNLMDRKIVELLREGKKFNSIVRDLHVGKKRIRKIYDLAQKAGYFDGKELPAFPLPLFEYQEPIIKNGPVSSVDEKLLGLLDWITDRREAGWLPITIYEELPMKVERSSFYRFMTRQKLNEYERFRCRLRVVPEILSVPGETLQLDWGKFRTVIDPKTGKSKTLWAFVGILAFSRLMMVRLVWDNKTETTLRAIESMFQEMNGVCAKIVSDNPKCFSIEASKYEPLLNPAFARFCSHYNITAEILPPRDPKKKGKVERSISFVRRLYQAHGEEWHGLDESQNHINKKVDLANQRVHGTTRLKPLAVFSSEEKDKLKPLPRTIFAEEEYHNGTVRKDGHVRFRNKYYSLEDKYIDKDVFIIGTNQTVSIYYKCNLLETHQRIQSPHQSKSTKVHHRKGWEQIMDDHQHLIKRARALGSFVEEVVVQILACGQGYVDYRKIWGILNLDKSYSADSINETCKKAIEIGEISYRTIKALLSLKPTNPEDFTINSKGKNRFLRPVEEYRNKYPLQ